MSVSQGSVYEHIYNLIEVSRDNQDLFPTESLNTAVKLSLVWHSQFYPRKTVQLGTGDGSTSIFDLNDDVIKVRSIEEEYGSAPTMYYSATEYEVKQGTANMEVVFDEAPGSGDVFGIHYSGTWTLTSVPSKDELPLACLAAAILCMRQATRFSESESGVIDADIVNYGQQARSWIRLKNEFVAMYAMSKGLSVDKVREGAPPPAWAVASVPKNERYDRYWWVTE